MPFLYALAGLLVNIAGSLVGRVLLALGVGYVTYSGADKSIQWIFQMIKDNINAMPPEIIQVIGFFWIDKAVSLIFSAITAALVIKMAGSDTITKMIIKS